MKLLPNTLTERAMLMLAWSVALVALWGAAHININYLEQVPHVQDSVNYLFQSQLFGMGKTTIEAPENVDSFASEHIIVQNGRWYCHYPFLVPLLFMFGMKLGLTWLVNPIIAMISVLLIFKIGKDNYNSLTGLWAAIFLTSSPFFMVMSASFMSHPTGLFFTTLCIHFFLRNIKKPSLKTTALTGATIGLLFNTRPLTAFAMGVITFMFYIRHRGRFKKAVLKHLAILIVVSLTGVAMFFAYSSHLSGKTLQFATHTKVSDVKGPSDIKIVNRFINSFAAAGVGKSGHTPAKGIGCVKALLELYHTYSLNWPGWLNLSLFLIPLIPWKRRESDAYLYWSFLVIPLLYSLYWRSAIMYGPRYIYEILPMTVLLSARGIDICISGADWLHRNSFLRTFRTKAAALTVTSIALYGFIGWMIYTNLDQFFIKSSYSLKDYPPVSLVPMKLTAMRNFNGVRTRIPGQVEDLGITDAVVFVDDGRWQGFGSVSCFNRPTLDTDVVYARDMGDEKNRSVLDMFPGKVAYWTRYPNVRLMHYIWNSETETFEKESLDEAKIKEKMKREKEQQQEP